MAVLSLASLFLRKYIPLKTRDMERILCNVIASCKSNVAKTIPKTDVDEYSKIVLTAPIDLNAIMKKYVDNPVPKIPTTAIFGICDILTLKGI